MELIIREGFVWLYTELLFLCLIQATKQKCRFHDHFPKFLVTTVYEYETRTASRSSWQVIRQFVFIRTCSSFVTFRTFDIIFSQPTLRCLRDFISIRNYPTKLHIQTQIHIPVCSLPHISFVSLLSVTANILFLCERVCKDMWFCLSYVQICFFSKHIKKQICRFFGFSFKADRLRILYTRWPWECH